MTNSIQVTQSSMPSYEEYIEEIKDLWESKWLTNNGSKHLKLEEELKQYLQTNNIVLYTNGHLALEDTLRALNLTGEVITTPFTFASTTHAIVRNGLTPIFSDINPNNYTIQLENLESLITEKTTAILPVHVYGNICDVEEINRIAQKYNLKVIYDAAHAFGVTLHGQSVANFGHASMFSFHATKVFNTIEGGTVTFKDPELKQVLECYKNFGINGPDTIEYIGGNAKMNEFQAAMGLCNLRYIDADIQKRKKVFERYLEQLSDIRGIKLPEIQNGVQSNYAYFPVVFETVSRDSIEIQLRKHNIFSRKYFYPLTSKYQCYENTFNTFETPIAQYVSERVLTLPLYAELSVGDVDRICSIIKTQLQVFYS